MHRATRLIVAALCGLASLLPAAPEFGGVREGIAAPRGAVLRWDRARNNSRDGTITYRIYERRGTNWNLGRPIAETKGTEWVVTNLPPGRETGFVVRAKDRSGEDDNRRAVLVRPTNSEPKAEWRAAWVTRFDWVASNAAEQRDRLARMARSLSRGGFNAVLFQVRGQGDTLYPSATEPWSPMLSRDIREIDPVGEAIAACRAQGLQFHAWINLSVVWQSKSRALPADRNHPFYRFADARKPATRLGLVHDAQGRPRQWGEDDYVWLTSGNPTVNAYLRQQVAAFIARYPVDGLHWDDRTGNPNGVSRDPVSVERFAGRGNPDRIGDLAAWQRDQLGRLLSDIYVVAKAKNPRLLVTAGPFGIANKQRIRGYRSFKDARDFGTDPEAWLAAGILDALCPQVYWDLPDPEPNYGTVVRDWLANNKSGRPIWPGSALGKFGRGTQPIDPVQARYVALSRALGAGGNTIYSWGGATPLQWENAGRTLYRQPATVPVPQHLRQPRGQVTGFVRDGGKRPVVDAWIQVAGNRYTHLSSGDGFYGIPNLRPGTYTLVVTGPSMKKRTVPFTVVAGQTTRLDLVVD